MMKDVAISAERLSLMIEFHHRGSLTSLDRSINFSRGSASKMELLKSTLEVNHRRNSNPSLSMKNSTPNLRRHGSLNRDKVRDVRPRCMTWRQRFYALFALQPYKDSSSSFTPLPLKKSQDTLFTLEEQIPRNSHRILEEEESSRDEISEIASK